MSRNLTNDCNNKADSMKSFKYLKFLSLPPRQPPPLTPNKQLTQKIDFKWFFLKFYVTRNVFPI